MKRKSFVASFLSLMLSVSGAVAADSVPWSGFYAGIHAGSVRYDNKFTENLVFLDSTSIKDKGGIYGGLIGYNWRNGNWVSGFELDIGVTSVSGYDDLFDTRSSLDWVANGRLRVGYVLDRSLFFIAGGISFAQVEQTVFTAGLHKQNYFAYGLTVGAGVETYVAQNWLFRAEYLYTNYLSFEQVYTPLSQGTSEIDTHIARVAIIYQFGGAKPQPVRTSGPADWSGAYFGAHYGQTSMHERHDVSGLIGGAFPVVGTTRDKGYFAGALAGINFQSGAWVTGFELDFGRGSLNSFEDDNFLGFPVESKLRWDAHIRARLGHVYGNYLFYVSAGMALAQFRQITPLTEASTKLFTGYTIGAGLDTLLAPNFIFRLEYLVSHYNYNTINTFIDTDLKTETVRAAIIYKYESGNFGTPSAPRGSYDWSGAYLGLHAGYHELTQNFHFLGTVDNFSFNGFNGGVLAGVNQQAGNWVWGFEVDLGKFDSKSVTRLSACLCDEVKVKGIADNHWRVRLGYAIGQYLPFVSAGIAFGKFEQSPSLDSPKKRLHTGFTAGGGVDAMLAQNWLLRLEYILSDYDLRIYNFTDTGGTVTDTYNKTHTIRAAVIYKFDQ